MTAVNGTDLGAARSVTREQFDKVMATHSRYPLKFGPTNVDRYVLDPKRFAFFLSRYKFAGKQLAKCRTILDVGCGDGMGTISFLSDTTAYRIVGIDFEPESIGYATDELLPALRHLRPTDATRLTFLHGDFLGQRRALGLFDGLACMDVIEHIEPLLGDAFIERLADVLAPHGVAAIGTPSLASAPFASVHSQAGHINLYDPDRFREALERRFRRVFLFSMNDEMVHTGFDKLAHYLIAVCVK